MCACRPIGIRFRFGEQFLREPLPVGRFTWAHGRCTFDKPAFLILQLFASFCAQASRALCIYSAAPANATSVAITPDPDCGCFALARSLTVDLAGNGWRNSRATSPPEHSPVRFRPAISMTKRLRVRECFRRDRATTDKGNTTESNAHPP